MRSQPIEPFLWLLFSAGGVMAAFVAPAVLLVFGVAAPLGWVTPPSHEHMLTLLGNPIARLLLFVVCSLALFHWAHRFRYTLYDGLQIKHLNEIINPLCYGGAIAGSVVAGYVLWGIL